MTLAHAATYLKTLADIEQATAVGDREYAWSLLDGIDREDLRALVDEFERATLVEREVSQAVPEATAVGPLMARDREGGLSRSASAAIDQDIERLAAASQAREEALYKTGGDPSALDAPPHRAVTEERQGSDPPPVAPVTHAGDNWKARCS